MEVIATTNAPKALVLILKLYWQVLFCLYPVRLLLIRKQVKWFKALLKLKLSRF